MTDANRLGSSSETLSWVLTGIVSVPREICRVVLAHWVSWFASVLRSQRSDDPLVRDSVGRAIPEEDAQRGEVHRQ
jgi:hypothetical protein